MSKQSFFGTFMQKQAFKKHYVQIVAEDMAQAREAMFQHFGDKFMTVYTFEEFKGQPETFGLSQIATINVITPPTGEPNYALVGGAPCL